MIFPCDEQLTVCPRCYKTPGGYLCDMLGAARALSIFAATLVVGQSVFAFGASIKNVGIMYVNSMMPGDLA